MTLIKATFVIILLWIFGPDTHVYAADNVIDTGVSKQRIKYWVFEDEQAKLSIEKIINLGPDRFKPGTPGGPNIGFTDSAYWFKFSLENNASEAFSIYANINYPLLDFVDFYVTKDALVIRHYKTGDRRNYYPRDVNHPGNIIELNMSPGESLTVYARVETRGPLFFSFDLIDHKTFFSDKNWEHLLQYAYFGALFMMMMLNAVIYSALREKTFLYYALLIFSLMIFFGGIRGYLFQWVFPYHWQVKDFVFMSSFSLLLFSTVQFTRHFLDTKEKEKKIDQILRYGAIACVVNFIISLALPYQYAAYLTLALAIPIAIVLSATGPVMWRSGERSGFYFSISWGVVIAGTVLSIIHQFGFGSSTFISYNSFQVGTALQISILMFSLAERLYHDREQKIAAQDLALAESKIRRDAQNQVIHFALHDQETELPNKTLFEMQISDTIKSNPDKRYFVGLIGIEQLREISRTLGLSYTDKLRKELAMRINQIVRNLPGTLLIEKSNKDEAWISAINSNIFGMLIDADAVKNNQSEYSQAMRSFHEPFKFEGLSIEISATFSAARYPEDNQDPTELVRCAFVALGESKKFAKSFAFFEKSMDIYDNQRLTMLTELRQAIKSDKVSVFYQPKLSLVDGTIVGFEALIRWRHELYGNIPPDKFIPIAEKTGIIRDLTRKVLSRAMEDYKRISVLLDNFKISVNISARNLMEDDLHSWLNKKLREHQLDTHCLILELTETAIMSDHERGVRALNVFDENGICISIDDFGTGHSSLHYLSELPVSEIKIDRSLICNLVDSAGSQIIVEKTIEMCQALGYRVVAEGIEDRPTMDKLKEMNCHIVQGYYISQPLPINDLLKWITANTSAPEMQ